MVNFISLARITFSKTKFEQVNAIYLKQNWVEFLLIVLKRDLMLYFGNNCMLKELLQDYTKDINFVFVTPQQG